ncbi:Bug family tripartite tricarboxylate transporter substrate binding protein [Paracraurococcus lichenis]|uniref:Tripartite tricarboxylate transporter substrate binding protein n=1 Tax=Paracraurococcus lichenis TaxID=3064888 RepID=A0ABT9DZX6_9PROT|nr:tripartite tricarboxylate transporter substrate binding protein [Paracraurococcus sp. LOR1-02]MDO9709439.1 tripartite tricarboxylate transporter substrate binding protein [Paracraurococcus sp. LOR1-02]
MTVPRRAALLGGLAATLAAPALAQGFPTRPVRIVVPIAPGGANDIIARLVSEKLPAVLGQPVVVENRPGAGGNIGGDAVAKAEKDGHTLLFTSANLLTANKWLYGRRMPFEPLRDLAPVTRVGIGTILMVCNSARPWKSFQDLVADAKAHPGRISMGSSGTGTISHLYMEKVKRAAGIDITHIPYRGGGPAITDLVSGTIDIMFDVIPALLPHIREGRFRPLAAGSAQRIGYVPELAEVPGMAELLPGSGIDALNWWSVTAPAGTPAPVLAQLNAAIRQVLEQEEVRRRLLDLTVLPTVDATPEAFGEFWRSQMPVWQALVEESGATAE